EVDKNAQGVEGTKGDKHYKCYHSQRKILTITKAMFNRSHQTHFPVLYRLYLYLKDHGEPPMEDEVAMALGKKILDPTQAAEYLLQLEKALSNIEANWDQNMFEQLLAEWMVACDQPFEEVDRL
ncbi:uncharacterized protein F5891DRAFT_899344, partial [Suillus fuscotomentosus]